MSIQRALTIGLFAITGTVFTGCQDKYIEKVTFVPSENLEVIRTSIVFTKKVKVNVGKGFALKDYGYLFLNPYTENNPFEIGLNLRTDIVNDQEYAELTPTSYLPNGAPTGIAHAVVQIRSPNPVHPKFDVFGYVDVAKHNWLGTAVIFTELGDQYFPEGLTVTQVFARDSEGRPALMGSVFGPVLDQNGEVEQASGIALFANFQALIKSGVIKPGQPVDFLAEPAVLLSGPAAPGFEGRYEELLEVQDWFFNGLNHKIRR